MVFRQIDTELIRGVIKKRDPQGHKGTFGHLLLVAGSHGMMGAALLASRAAMYSGTGKLTAHIPSAENIIIQLGVPEALAQSDRFSAQHWAEPVNTEQYSAVAIGPGIGQHVETESALEHQLNILAHKPVLLDADALNIMSHHPTLFQTLPEQTIITPHIGEMARICEALGYSTATLDGYLKAALHLAQEYHVTVVLKCHKTHICTPSGQVYVNGWPPNSGLATAGSGDVLAGITAAFLAQGYSTVQAAIVGVWLHSMAGDLARRQVGEFSLTASHIIDYLPQAITATVTPNVA